jgi:hypothetical protein
MNRARMGTAAAYESMQGSHGISEARTAAAAAVYCMDDYSMQAMATRRRIKEEGRRWQGRDAAAAAAASSLPAVGCLVQESDPFKVHQLKSKTQ